MSWSNGTPTRLIPQTFASTHVGFAIWPPGRGLGAHEVFATSDGGRTWRRRASVCDGGGIAGLSFVDAVRGWAYCAFEGGAGSEPKIVVRTTDGGLTWHIQAASTSVFLPNVSEHGGLPLEGYPAGIEMHRTGAGWTWNDYLPMLTRTRNAGSNWRTTVLSGGDAVGLMDGSFPSDRHGFLLIWTGDNGQMRRTSDGGRTWVRTCKWIGFNPQQLPSCD